MSSDPRLIRSEAEGSLYYFAKHVLGYSDLNDHHERLCDWMQDPNRRRQRVLWPRGTYKTTIGLCFLLREIILDPEARWLIYSANREEAKKRLKVLKTHMERNRMLPGLWPKIFFDDPVSQSPKWTDEICTVRRRGIYTEETFETGSLEKSITGRHYTGAMCDDLVTNENYRSQIGLQAAIDGWQDLRPVLAKGRQGKATYKELVLGTVYDDGDLYGWQDENVPESDLARNTRGIWTDDTESETILGNDLTPEMLAEIRRSMTSSQFVHQYLNERVSSDTAMFKEEDLKAGEYSVEPESSMYVTICMDPGRKIGSKNDKTAITVRGVTLDGHIWALEDWSGRLLLRERAVKLHDICTEVDKRRKVSRVGIEDTDAVNIKAFEDVCSERRKWFGVDEIKPRGRTKGSRVEKVQPATEQKRFHLRSNMVESKVQFVRFKAGSARRDDLADSWSMHWDLDDGRPSAPKVVEPYMTPDAMAARVKRQMGRMGQKAAVGAFARGGRKKHHVEISWSAKEGMVANA